ncbi:MAG: DUF4010 domain-containing protein [Candidatus Staskawiczbacteria bacterium]|nr:DUF4010 domain-containing protein [Candidatus Staskawiczbacteria bacterium]
MIPTAAIHLFLALLFGAAIGLERESSKQGDGSAGGIRTYSLIAMLGAVCGILYTSNLQLLALLIIAVFFIILVSYYCLNAFMTKDVGMTSELAIFFTFLLGMLPVLNIVPLHLIIALFVILVLILSLKKKIQKLVGGISYQEIESFISYAIIALVVLPFLPNVGYKLTDLPILPSIFESLGVNLGQFATLELINPQKIWITIALITGIDVFGYIMGRLIGNKSSFTLASFIGGFISSTSTIQSLAQRSKKTGLVNYLVGAAILANAASLLQVFLLVGPLNAKWLTFLVPSLFIMLAGSAVLIFFFLRNKDDGHQTEQKTEKRHDKIFSLVPALKFAAILILVKIGTKVCLILFGESGFVISSIIASFAGIDAIMVNLADMAGGVISFKFALITFLLVNATNLVSKSLYAFFQGNRKFSLKFSLSMLVVIALSFTGLLLIR